MKIAYILLVHKDPDQILRLVKSLGETGDFYINVDKKSKFEPFEETFTGIDNVYFLKRRINVTWAGWSMVKGYMELLNLAYNSDKRYDRFVFLTGQDYPLMTNGEIISEFESHRDTEYVMAYNIVTSTVLTDKNKVLKKWYLDNPFRSRFLQRAYKSVTYRLITKRFQRKEINVKLGGKLVPPYFGQMLSAFTREGAKLILNTYLNDRAFNKRMKTAFAAVEIYWQTIIFNSELRKNTIQNGEEHEITEHFGWAPLHYHHYDVDTSVFTEEDFEEIKNSGFMFFRKVSPSVSSKLMDKVDILRNEKENFNCSK